jgi:hypothetical protein
MQYPTNKDKLMGHILTYLLDAKLISILFFEYNFMNRSDGYPFLTIMINWELIDEMNFMFNE